MIDPVRINHHLGAGAAVKSGDRDAPDTLPREAPVRARLEHSVDPPLPPIRDPLDRLNGVETTLPQLVMLHAQKPLLRRTKHKRSSAPAVVRIAVMDLFTFGVQEVP